MLASSQPLSEVGSVYVDQELRLQEDRLGSTVTELAPQLAQLQLDLAKPAASEPEAVLQLDRLQLDLL